MRQLKILSSDIIVICERYINGESMCRLATSYKVTQTYISRILKANNVEIRSRSETNRIYSCNDSFFSSIDNENKAYWLGFIAADGYLQYVPRNGKKIGIGLSSVDHDHLVKFKTDIEATNPINSYINKAVIDIHSHKMFDDLCTLEITPNKTHTLKFPILKPDLLKHYIRGYFDGDGSWIVNKTGNIYFSITSNIVHLTSIQNTLMKSCYLNKTKFDVRRKDNPNTVTMIYGGNRQTKRIATYLYEDATVYLERKRQVIQDKISTFQ